MQTHTDEPKPNNGKPAGQTPQLRSPQARARSNQAFRAVAVAGTTVAIAILFILLATIVLQGAGRLSWSFVTSMASYKPEEAGIYAALIGTIIICAICGLCAVPLGVGSAILIEEYRPKNRWARRAHGMIETNIRNLAGIPSIVYGILGVTAFATMLGLFGTAGKSHYAIGQQWFDQYADAQGNLIFVEVDSFDTPTNPLYAGPVQAPERFEIWRGKKTPLVLGTQTQLDPEANIDDSDAQRLDVNATLDVRDGGWVLNLTDASDQALDLAELGAAEGDIVRFGFFFDDYTQQTRHSNFTITGVGDGELMLFGGPITTFRDSVQPDSDPVQLQIMPRASFGPLLSQIEAELKVFEDAIQDGVNATRSGSRNNGPAQIEQAAAEQIVDNAIAAGPFTGDTSALRETLIGQILPLDGQESRALRSARRQITQSAAQSERDARMRGKVLGGENPNRVDHRDWYYLSLPLGRGVLAGGLTLMLVILPIVIVASQEALRAVPESYRQGAQALGATKWQAISTTALPAAIPGICTGTILALSRAFGEAAPILMIAGGIVFVNFTPGNAMDSFTVLPLQIFNWAGQPQDAYRELAAAGIIVLLCVLLCFNALAIYIRQRASKHR